MILGVALSVTAVTLLGALVGNRFGLVAAVGRVGPLVVACVAGSVLVGWGFQARWFQPFGLGTPIIAAIPVSVFLWLLCRFILYERHKERIPFAGTLIDRCGGTVLGAAGGVYTSALLWILLLLGQGGAFTRTQAAEEDRTSAEPESSVLHELVQTAHRGFVRHLPFLGPLSDEADALVYVLHRSPAFHAELARSARFQAVGELRSLHLIYEDEEIMAEIDSIGRGNLSPLLMLLKDPKIVAFFEEESVRALLVEARPTFLAARLGEIERDLEERRPSPAEN
jgi:hypothetical protein